MIGTSAKILRTLKIGDEVIIQDNEEGVRHHGNLWEVGKVFITIIKAKGSKIQFPMHMFDSQEYTVFLKV